MARVLMAWELGSGFGHVARLLAIATELAQSGHQPILALRDLVEPAPLLQRAPFPVVQAPLWHREQTDRTARRRVFSYADVLAVHGFTDAAQLLPMVQAWQTLFDQTRPQLIIADHCPTACLAAYPAIPVVQVGNGFTVPPATATRLPPLVPEHELDDVDARILRTIEEVQSARSRPAPRSLAILAEEADQFVMTFCELDPYRKLRRVAAIGPQHWLPSRPVPTSPRFFAYLSTDYPAVDQILAALSQAGLAGEAYLRGASAAVRQSLRGAGLQIHDTPPNLMDVFQRTSVLLHHAGVGTAELALTAGCPQLLFPRHLEQKLTADAVAALGVGRALAGTIRISEIVQFVRRLNDPNYQQAAARTAERLPRPNSSPLDRVISRCQLHIAPEN